MGAPLQDEAFPCPLSKMAAKGRSSGLPARSLVPSQLWQPCCSVGPDPGPQGCGRAAPSAGEGVRVSGRLERDNNCFFFFFF